MIVTLLSYCMYSCVVLAPISPVSALNRCEEEGERRGKCLGQSLPIGRHWLPPLLVAGSRLRSSGPALTLSSSHGAQLGWSEMAANVCGETRNERCGSIT